MRGSVCLLGDDEEADIIALLLLDTGSLATHTSLDNITTYSDIYLFATIKNIMNIYLNVSKKDLLRLVGKLTWWYCRTLHATDRLDDKITLGIRRRGYNAVSRSRSLMFLLVPFAQLPSITRR